MKVILENGGIVKTSNGKMIDLNKKIKTVEVKTFAEASKAISNYINKYNLTASCFDGGQIIENGKQIARVSYNGRVWDMNDNEIK